MSIAKVSKLVSHADCWREAIADAGRLIAESEDKDEKRRLWLAVEWFKHRLKTGAPFPGLKTLRKSLS